jgi:two-component system NtrC family sensor kinase
LIEREPFDAIISDVLMPDMDGIALYERLAEQRPELARRLIFTTGDAARPAMRVFLRSTGAPFLLKPFTSTELLAALRKVLSTPGDAE